MPPAAAAAHVRGVVDAGAPRSDVWRGPLKSWVRIATAARACVSARSLTHAHVHAHAHTHAHTGTHTLTHARTRTHMPSHAHTCPHTRVHTVRLGRRGNAARRTRISVVIQKTPSTAVTWETCGPSRTGTCGRGSSAGGPPGRACALPRAALPSRGSRRGGQPPAAPHTSAPAEESARLGGRVRGTEAPRAGPGAAWAPPRGTSRPQAPFCPRPLCMWNRRAGR